MTLKSWLKNMDLVFDVSIWGKNDEEPLYEGLAFNIPWTIIDYPIGRMNDKDEQEPIYVYVYKNEHGVSLPKIVINVIENDKKDEDGWF